MPFDHKVDTCSKLKRTFPGNRDHYIFLHSLNDYILQGRPKTAKKVAEECVMYSENVPNTNSGTYGSR